MDSHLLAFATTEPDPQVTELGCRRDFGSKEGDRGRVKGRCEY